MSQCTKPSMAPKVTKARDELWRERKKPDLFWNSQRWLSQALDERREKGEAIINEDALREKQKPISTTAAACAGGSTYVDVLIQQMGQSS